MYDAVLKYIHKTWPRHIRQGDDVPNGTSPLPYPFTTPSPPESYTFQALFYWDSFYTHLGYLKQGMIEQVLNDVNNHLYLVDIYGFVPCSTYQVDNNRSQHPYLSADVRQAFEYTGDTTWLAAAFPRLEREYDFWQQQRNTVCGLNRGGHNATDPEALGAFVEQVCKRLARTTCTTDEERSALAGHHYAEAESGWDFTPRFNARGLDFVPVDLNMQLYNYEKNMAYFSRILENTQTKIWEERAATRAERIQALCWNEERGCFLDYDYVNRSQSSVFSVASLTPLQFGIASKEQAERTIALLPLLEGEHGVAATECCDPPTGHQWAWPSVWPPLQYITNAALTRYDFREDAQRLRKKYLNTCVRHFQETGQLWEKYDAETGEHGGGEYTAPPMMGWTAGVFVHFAQRAE